MTVPEGHVRPLLQKCQKRKRGEEETMEEGGDSD